MKIVASIFTILWVGFWSFIGITSLLNTPQQIKKDKDFIETEIKPAVNFIKNFKKLSKRLPTSREFYTWEREYYKDYSSYLNQQADSLISDFAKVNYIRHNSDILGEDQSKFKNANWSKDFSIAVWRGEWMEYYYSWNDSYDTNNYSLSDGIISLFAYCTVGLLPIIFWWRYFRQRKKTAHINVFAAMPADE